MLHRHPAVSLEVVEMETLLIILENLFDLLLELGDPVSRWMFSVPALVIFGLLASFCSVSRRTQERSEVSRSASRITFSVSTTITDGNARIGSRSSFLPLRWPDCTLSRLRAEEHDRPVTQSIATPEPSSRTIPTLDRTLVACKSFECVTTPGSRRSCPG